MSIRREADKINLCNVPSVPVPPLKGARQPGESFGACVHRNANEATFGAVDAISNEAMAGVVITGSAISMMLNTPSLLAPAFKQTASGGTSFYTTLGATIGGVIGAGFGAMRAGIAAGATVTEGVSVATGFVAASVIGIGAGSAIACR